MISSHKKDCPHIENLNLIDLEKFKKIPFGNLKCTKCNEIKELLICLICGEAYCSKNINSHFAEHNKDNQDHCLFIELINLDIWCNECIDEKNNNSNSEDKTNNKGCYIESNTFTNKYIKIVEEYKLGNKEGKLNNSSENKNNLEKKDEIKNKPLFENKNEICMHIKDEKIINVFNDSLETYFKIALRNLQNNKDDIIFAGVCLICGDRIDNLDSLDKHYNAQKHKLYINLLDFTIICMECKNKYNLDLMNDKKYRILFQYLYEKEIELPNQIKLLTKEEIYQIKYHNLINDFINKKFSKILFMVGAGISTSAGIPDFRSNTGLFKQLQDKYNLSSPEEFFRLPTFLKNPMYFYEFTKLFDLSKVNPTISHKFMNFLVHKNIVRYIYTQNIDGLEKKAKIPDEKLIFSHGNFYEGHCPKCQCSIDIQKINEGIEKGEVYYCPTCKGPCKPNVVFYGEGLPFRFFEKLQECKDVDLIIIMGTSLKVKPFALIPNLVNPSAYKLVFNMEEVGDFGYNYLECDSIFIQGKTDKSIIQFLKDTKLFDEFTGFIKNEYNEDLNILIDKENELINLNKNKENIISKDELNDVLKNINLNENK